ncbi:MAG: alkaline phosphatase [Balneolales bacterium]
MNNRKAPSANGVSRRDFLKTGALSSFALGSGAFIKGCSPGGTAGGSIKGTAKNVIFLVSDGMSMGTLTMADQMTRRRDGRTSNWIRLYEQQRVNRGVMDMASLDSIVTDSAAAAASWGCGHRINNGALCMGPGGEIYPTILETYRDAGKATGLVTTAEITHATPAGFSVNIPSRYMGEEIADQYLEREYDLLMGGGNRHFSASRRSDDKDLYAEFASKGYHIARKKSGLANLQNDGGKLLGVFANGHLPYTTDQVSIPDLQRDVPTLAEMSSLAMDRLSTNTDGFILQIEGGRVDHAAHSNDVAGLLFDQMAFDDAIGAVLDFTDGRDDTLVIITSDHGNANPGLNGHNNPNARFDSIAGFKHTNDWILSELDESSTVSQVRERVEEATRLQISSREAEALISAMQGNYETLYQPRNGTSSVMGTILANYTGVNWIGSMHTSDYVELASMGPGSQSLSYFTRNTDLFDLMVEVAGVEVSPAV